MKRAKVIVTMKVECSVMLPAGREHEGQACDDPAVEAALCGLPQVCEVFLWGKENEPARLHYEAHEEDCIVEEDERE